MSQFVTREQRGIYVHVLATKMYKKNTIVATLTQDLQEETATQVALLPYVLTRGSQKYPTPEKLQLALDDLYGANLWGSIDKKGERHILDFTMSAPNEKFLSTDEPLLEQSLAILADVMMHPATAGEGFVPENVTAEIDQHRKRIQAVIDDKMSFASLRCQEELTKGEPYSIPRLGREEQLDKIDAKELYDLYREILKTAPIHFYVIGDVEADAVAEQIFRTFDYERAPVTEFRPVQVLHEAREVHEVVDELDVNQGKLNIGYWTNVEFSSDEDYPALVVFNGIFGGYPHSKLFMNVREKHSLAYYAVSRFDPLKGILYMMSGVEFANFDKALEITAEQLEAMRRGEISEEEMSFTINSLMNDYKTGGDSATSVADFHLNGLIGGKVRTREEIIELVQKVTVDDVVRIAKRIQLDTIYKLQGKGGEATHA